MTQPDDMATINAALHGDKRTVLQQQLKEIDREILEYLILELAQRQRYAQGNLGTARSVRAAQAE